MLINKLFNYKFLTAIITCYIAYYFTPIIYNSPGKALTYLAAVVFVILFLKKVEYAFYFILATRSIIDVFYNVEGAADIRLTYMLAGGLGVIFIYYIIIVSRLNILHLFEIGVNKIYIAFLVSSIPAVYFSYYIIGLLSGAGYWFRLFQVFISLNLTILVLLDAGTELYKKRIKRICWAVIISLIVPYITYIKNYFKGKYVVSYGKEAFRQIDTYGGMPNTLSYHLLCVLPFCLFLFLLPATKFKKTLWSVLIGTIFFTVYVGYVRNVWIALGVLLMTSLVLRKKIITISFIGIFAVLFIISNPTIMDYFKDISAVLYSDQGFFELDPHLLSHRLVVWQTSLSYFMDHSSLMEKIFGNGFRSDIIIATTYEKGNKMPEHNNYLTLLMNVGILGLCCYLLYIFKLFQESYILLKRTNENFNRNLVLVFIPFLCAYISLSLATHIMWNITFQFYFATFAGFVIAANILEKSARNSEMNNR